MARSPAALVERAPAKVNLSLHVLGRRADGYHTIDSLVAFADVADELTFAPGGEAQLVVSGENARAAGPLSDNLVLRAANALAAAIPGLTLGRFTLTKVLPVAAGIGGGSSDAAAALRLLARAGRIRRDDPRLLRVAAKVGADVPVCVDPRSRRMRGIGERLSAPSGIPGLRAVLVNPGVAVPTKDVFAILDRMPAQNAARSGMPRAIPRGRTAFVEFLTRQRNDLEAPAIQLAPAIADALRELREAQGCTLARMSGSGATCFGLFASPQQAETAARRIKASHPQWWVVPTILR